MTAPRASASRKLPRTAGTGRSSGSPPCTCPPSTPLPPRCPLSPLHPGVGPLSCCPPWSLEGSLLLHGRVMALCEGEHQFAICQDEKQHRGSPVTARLLEDLTLKQLQPAHVAFANSTPKKPNLPSSKAPGPLQDCYEICVSAVPGQSRGNQINPAGQNSGREGKNKTNPQIY